MVMLGLKLFPSKGKAEKGKTKHIGAPERYSSVGRSAGCGAAGQCV